MFEISAILFTAKWLIRLACILLFSASSTLVYAAKLIIISKFPDSIKVLRSLIDYISSWSLEVKTKWWGIFVSSDSFLRDLPSWLFEPVTKIFIYS